MPGVHSTMVTGHAEMPEIAILTQHLVDRFLIDHGTSLRNPIRLSDLEVCEYYATIRKAGLRCGLVQGAGGRRAVSWGDG